MWFCWPWGNSFVNKSYVRSTNAVYMTFINRTSFLSQRVLEKHEMCKRDWTEWKVPVWGRPEGKRGKHQRVEAGWGGWAMWVDRMIEATGLLEGWTQITAEDTPAAMRWLCLQALNLLRGCQRAGTVSQAYVCDMLLGRCRSSKSVVECNKAQILCYCTF